MRRLLALLSLATACAVPASDAFADWPKVAITYPAANTTFTSALTPTIIFQASVSDSDEGIFGVAFFVCVASGSACSSTPFIAGSVVLLSPYQLQWTPPLAPVLTQAGAAVSYLVWASADNMLGQSTDSTTVPFTVVYPPGLPNIKLIEPEPQSEFVAPGAPVLYATATSGTANAGVESTIARVDFLDAGVVIGSVATPNVLPAGYAFIWRNPATGPHSISARATDSLGNASSSRAAAVFIADPDQPPQVDLTSPSTGQIFGPGSVIALAATASSSEGTIERVEFVEGNTTIATSRTPPYTASWVDPPPGNFTVVAIAYDDLEGATASRPAYIQVLKLPRSPAVVLTAPTPGSTIPATVPLPLAANALAPDGSIGRVDFYVGTTVVGSAATAPYTATWATPQIGARSITAKAYDPLGFSSSSTPVPITVTSSLVPTVAISAPASNATFNAPATITVTATAGEPGGSIARVDFYANGNLIGSKTTAPYTVTLSPGIGGYTLSAKATDGVGTVATAAGIPVTVLPPAPTILLAAPSNGAVYAPGQTIVLNVNATTPQSTIARIEFDSDGAAIQTINAVAGVSTGTFSLNWTGATPGTHALTAKVYSTSGGSATSASASVTVADLAVALLEPAPGQVFAASTPISLTAAPSETGGTIVKVEFYADGALVGASTAPPYTATWSSSAAGSHSITARVSDAAGLTMTSAAAAVTVIAMPIAQIDSGIDGGTVGDDNATISGSVQAPLNSALAINGLPAVLDPNGRFFIENLKLQPGSNTITITLNSQGSAPIVKTITLGSTGIAPFEVALDKQEGLAPLTVNVTIKNRGSIPFKRITVDTTSDGVADVTLTALPPGGTTQSITYGTAGLYTMRVTVYDASDNLIYTATRRVRAVDPAEVGYKLASVYATLVNQLAANNVNGALTAFVDGARDRYSSVFTALGTSLPTVSGQLGTLTNIVVMEEVGELTVARSVGSDTQIFMMYLIRGSDGLWRIETM